jgi:tetratricopeptide (TPR) repeat protein
LTHYLLTTDFDQKTHRIPEYLRLVDQHVDPVTAAQQAFGDVKKLQSTLASYTNRMSYTVLKINSAAAPIDPNTMTATPLTPPQVDAWRADLLAYNRRTADARALLDAVLKADPNNVLAHETMGYLEFHDGHRDEAKKWYAQAVALDSHSFLAHYYFALLSLMDGDTGADVEASLRTAIKLNARYAPAYDGLAQLFGHRHENLDEAHTMSLEAIALEPDNLNYRLNAANVLMEQHRFEDAMRVLEVAKSVARTPEDANVVEMRLGQVRVYKDEYAQQQAREAEAKSAAAGPGEVTSAVKVIGGPIGGKPATVAPDAGGAETAAPKHPTETPHGRMLTAWGVLHGVACSYPAVMEVRLDNVKGKPANTSLSLYSNNYFKVDYRAGNYTPRDEVHPCQDLEGMKVEVEYFKTADTTVDGQIVAIMMMK